MSNRQLPVNIMQIEVDFSAVPINQPTNFSNMSVADLNCDFLLSICHAYFSASVSNKIMSHKILIITSSIFVYQGPQAISLFCLQG